MGLVGISIFNWKAGSNMLFGNLMAFQKDEMKIIIMGLLFVLTMAIKMPQARGADDIFFLSFPLSEYHAYNAPIGSVFDHTMDIPYGKDTRVVAYTGEVGNFIKSICPFCDGCYNTINGRSFVVNGNYTGIVNCGVSKFLCYDGHPGFDYPVPAGTPVYAAAEGIASFPDSYPGIMDAQFFNAIEIDHHNGYKTYYVHLSEQLIAPGQRVSRGQLIGSSGNVGSPGFYHLHFEVQYQGVPVDPYGWKGDGSDPYQRAVNVELWAPGDPDIQ